MTKHKLLLGLGVLLALVVVFWSPVIFFNRSIFAGDLRGTIWPTQFFHFSHMTSRPLWNPYIFCGVPTFAHPMTLFSYPLAMACYAIFDAIHAANFLVIINYFLGGAFMYLYLSEIGLQTTGALVGAMIVTFGGNAVWHAIHSEVLSISIYLPLLLYFFERFLKNQTLRSFIPLPLVFGAMMTICHPQSLMFFSYLFSAYAAVRFWQGSPMRHWKKFLPAIAICGATGLLGACIGGITAIPLLEVLQYSERSGGGNIQFATMHSWPPINFILFFMPHFFGRLLHDVLGGGTMVQEFWGQYYDSWGHFMNYIGLLPLGLAAIGFGMTDHPLKKFFGITALLTAFLALGKYTPLYSIFFEILPGFKFFRGPMHFWQISSFCMAVLAGIGASHLTSVIFLPASPSPQKNPKKTKLPSQAPNSGFNRLALILWSVLAVSLVTVLTYLFKFESYLINNPWQMLPPTPTEIWSRESYNLLCFALSWSSAATLLWYLSSPARRTLMTISRWSFLLILVLSADFFGWFFTYNPTLPAQQVILPSAPAHWMAQQSLDPFRVYTFRRPSSSDPWRNFDPLGLSMNIFHRTSKTDGYLATHIKSYNPQFLEAMGKNRKLLDLANVKYFVIDERIQTNPTVLPRAFFIDRVKTIPDESMRLTELATLDPSSWLILENWKFTEGLTLEQRGFRQDATARITKYEPDSIHITVQAPADGFLFLSEAYYPGWIATDSGSPVPIYRANHTFRAIPLHKGNHEIDFLYQPQSLKWGSLLSLSSLLLLGLLTVLFGKKTIISFQHPEIKK